MSEVETDPRVSCPIVCGEYMRATGFFYESGKQVYLITARHNVLPTNEDKLKTGRMEMDYTTTDFLPTIDIYLQEAAGTAVETVDIRYTDGTTSLAGIDIIAVPVEFNPREFGYVVWSADDVAGPDSATETLESIGFNGDSFPSSDLPYNKELYRQSKITPQTLSIMNNDLNLAVPCGLADWGLEVERYGNSGANNGFSGSPVLGNDLLGVHGVTMTPYESGFEKLELEPCNLIIYWPATILPKLFD